MVASHSRHVDKHRLGTFAELPGLAIPPKAFTSATPACKNAYAARSALCMECAWDDVRFAVTN